MNINLKATNFELTSGYPRIRGEESERAGKNLSAGWTKASKLGWK